MPEAVLDTTVLIAFGHLDRLDLLPRLYEPVLVPEMVRGEATSQPDFAEVPRIRRAFDSRLLQLIDDPSVTDPRLRDLGAGEAAVISTALTRGAVAVIDDWQARRIARACGLTVVGTVGLLIQARRRGHVAAAEPLVRQLRSAGFRLGTAELDAARAADVPTAEE